MLCHGSRKDRQAMNGSIEKRIGKRGVSWYAKYSVTDPATGKRVHRRVSAKTKAEAEAKLRAAIMAAERGQFGIDDRLTIRDFIERWLAAIEPTVRPSTHRRYQDLMRLHVLPAIGAIRLTKLSPADLQRLYADRLAYGLGPTSVSHLHFV